MTSKAVAIGVSLILVVGVVIGAVVVGINSKGKSSGSGDLNLSTNIKAVEVMCAPTSYKDKCRSIIGPVAANTSAGPKDYLRAALVATMEEMKVGLEKSQTIKSDSFKLYDKRALNACKVFIQDAIDSLQKALTMLAENELDVVNEEVDEFRNWLSAVDAFQVTCLEQLENSDLKAQMDDGLRLATLFTVNALDIFAELTKILASLDIPLKVNPNNQRKLLDLVDVDEHGYPDWLAEGDRRSLLGKPKPDVTVARDGSGNVKTIAEAFALHPKKLPRKKRFVIYVKAGVYEEVNLTLHKHANNVYMYGDGPEKTIITGDKNYKIKRYPTSETGSFTATAEDFVAKSIGFVNKAGPEGDQAVALYVKGDRSAFFNCKIEGYQDSLYVNANRQFYRECDIIGTIDFVFGQSKTLIQNSRIIVRKPLPQQTNIVAADGTNTTTGTTGIVFQNCTITADKDFNPVTSKILTFLGRPWKEYSRVIFMESTIDGFIDPKGWSEWNSSHPNTQYSFFVEYANNGPGAKTDQRASWTKIITDPKVAFKYTFTPFIGGQKWVKPARIPFYPGLKDHPVQP